MGDIIELDEVTTLKGILFLIDYVRSEAIRPDRFVHVRKHGLFAKMNGLEYELDVCVRVSDMPIVKSCFYNIPILKSELNLVFDNLYMIGATKGFNQSNYFPEVRNCNKSIFYEYSHTLCRGITGFDAKNRRKLLRTKFEDILSELKG